MKIFTRIFVGFWITAVALIAITILFILSVPESSDPQSFYSPRTCMLAANDVYQRGGADALARYLGRATTTCGPAFLLYRNRIRMTDILDSNLYPVENGPAVDQTNHAAMEVRTLPWHTVAAFPKDFGMNPPSIFIVMHPPYTFFAHFTASVPSVSLHVAWRLALLVLIPGVFSYLLASYFIRPVTRFAGLAEQLGSGNLKARIDNSFTERRDELGGLSRTFNEMAGQIEAHVAGQKRFLAQISHELGSPLTRVNMALALAQKKTPPSLEPELDRIGYEANLLNELVQELLFLARLESGNEVERQTTTFSVASVIDEACTDARFEAEQIHKTLRIDCREDFMVTGHRDLLRRALDNVLRNSVRFARADGYINVEFFPSSTGAVGIISIRDDGPGIRPYQEHIIFDPFVTLPDRVTGVAGGSGLGLAIARQAVLANAGKILARNADSGGLVVTIELPIS